jgi:uncharacterized delta-60 repeat protein
MNAYPSAALAGLAALAFSLGAEGQPPLPDANFGGPDGIARVAFDLAGNQGDLARTATVMADGRLLLAGKVEVAPNTYDIAFARLSALDGSLDAAFGPDDDGRALAGLAPIVHLTDLAQVPEGALYLGTSSDGVAVVGRIDDDGVADAGFNGNGHRFLGAGYFVDGATALALSRVIALTGGKILVTGYAGSTAGICAVAARFLADGSSDTTFGAGTGRICVAPVTESPPAAGAFGATVDAQGRILLAGVSSHVGGSGMDMSVARLSPDGSLDLGFGTDDGWAHVAFDQGGTLWDGAFVVEVDAAGRIALAGQVETQVNYEIGIARLLPDGVLDTNFGSGGRVQVGFDHGGWNWNNAHSLSALPDGRLLVGGQIQSNGTVGVAVMLRPDGSLEPRFGLGGLFALTDPDGPESGVLNAQRMVLDGDYMYMVGEIIDPVLLPGSMRNYDFGATRHVIPLFSDGFDGDLPAPDGGAGPRR